MTIIVEEIRRPEPQCGVPTRPDQEGVGEDRPGPGGFEERIAQFLAWLKGTVGWRKYRSYRVRVAVQGFFALASVVVGIQLARFVAAAQSMRLPLPQRPPGAEAYLPIGGLMGALDWLYQGTLNLVHPAATVLFLIFLGTSLLFKRSFCSWICPIGLLSETLNRLGVRAFRKDVRVPKWLDVPLRGFRYLLLLFFLWAILDMGARGLQDFIHSPYNQVADVKMYLFFAEIGTTGLLTIGLLAAASFFINGAWCRYLCPYGALMGLGALISPFKVRRAPDSCIDCGLCDRVCMGAVPVSKKKTVNSVECTACLDCVAVCPVEDTLTFGTRRRRLGVLGLALGVMHLFFAGYTTARATGTWDNQVSDEEYIQHLQHLDGPGYGHP